MTASSTTGLDVALLRRCADTIRVLSAEAVQKANSGHPGMPMGMADVATILWTQVMQHDPRRPDWANRDRFVLSAGHGSMLLYSLLHLTGYDLSLDEIKNFRQWGSHTPGHPEHGYTAGVETTTGPLGQGIATAVGMAIGERLLAERFNRPDAVIVDHHTYVICSDGDLMEGISHEACSMAGHLKLGKLIVMYDANKITIDSSTDMTFTEDVGARFEAYEWNVQHIDGHDYAAIAEALARAKSQNDRPNIIICRTTIGKGSPNRQGTSKAHGEALGVDEVKLVKQQLGWPEEAFFIPDDALAAFRQSIERGEAAHSEWEATYNQWRARNPELAQLWDKMMSRELPNWDVITPFPADAKGIATRQASGTVLNAVAPHVPGLIGGSADLHGSNFTLIKGEKPVQADSFDGRNFYFGVREHAMAAAMNGMALHGGFIPYGGTFLTFTDYMRPSMRLAALMHQQVIYVLTHDSIGLGEDGPTHQPIEHLSSLRAMPNMDIMRPGDANETAYAWRAALERKDGPTGFALSRQAVPTFDRTNADPDLGAFSPAEGVLKGGYILVSSGNRQPDIILMASGTELTIAVEAARILAKQGKAVRVVSMACTTLFDRQDAAYHEQVLPKAVTRRIVVEAAASWGWERYIGSQGRAVCIDRFGASAPYKEIYQQYGITPEHVAEVAQELLSNG